MVKIRKLPAQGARVESGAVQFGDDWPGTFIRGDNAAHFAMWLEHFMSGNTDPITMAVVRGLLDTLKSRDLRSQTDAAAP